MYPIDLLSPSHLFSNVLSVLNSVQLLSRKEAPGAQPTPADFEVNLQTNTGFLPEKPIPRLPEAYSAWENALTRAQEVLVLGENLTEQDTESRADGEIQNSSLSCPFLCSFHTTGPDGRFGTYPPISGDSVA
jgi:indoleamine 2,3-dioxygenase